MSYAIYSTVDTFDSSVFVTYLFPFQRKLTHKKNLTEISWATKEQQPRDKISPGHESKSKHKALLYLMRH